ncbi:hypothetical protein K457DRAFT_139089 [Linnemannia elongata AG-77]|uniref:Uncharacterized protein n=1 Tax=Linnemannia elongata AG-77 TaxID=1314771 RepID=A0A197JU54_9FUNG|nr:hypothetical protein K457DRAFT_139089 [Linnemannia elongata AG-77]
MTSHPSSGWRRTVGAQWSSVKRQQDASSPSSPHPMQQGMHSSLLVALSRPDLDQDYQHQQQQELLLQQQQELQQLQQQQQYQQEQQALLLQQQQQQQSQQQQVVTSSYPGSMLDQTVAHNNTQSEHQRALQQFNENQKQQQLYLQQLQLMQRLQSMPGSTTRPWYPTFGPAITTSCSDSTILLDSPHQYRLINNAKLNRHAVGPHWRSIQTSSTYSPTPSPPSSSPQLQARTLAPSSSSLSTSSSSSSLSTMPCTTTALHAYLSSTYSSAASIDQARATSFHQHGHGHGMESNALPEGRQGTQDEPVHHQYYQSHSYPHDPRHHPHPAYHPGNSREARDSSPLANRASPLTPASERFADSSRKMKRKAAWQDQDNSNSNNNNENGDNDDEDEGGNERSSRNRQEENDSERRIKPSMMSSDSSQGFQPMSLSVGGLPRSESQTASQPYSIQSSIQQFIPITTSTASSHHFAPSRSNVVEQEQDQDQDQDMGSVDSFNVGANAASFPTPSSRPSPMSMETSSVDQEDMDVVLTSTESGVSKQSKRTKPRLNPTVFGTMSIAETLREQSGERIQDIFQECFYNAASSSTR